MDKIYQVFVSSTFADLKEARKKVAIALQSMNCTTMGMERFPAIDEDQFDYIKSVIDKCDYYVLILGARYGTISNDGISYTEKEYNYAVSKKIPVIAFPHSNPDSISSLTDPNKRAAKKLAAFREKVLKGRIVKFWENADDLATNVAISLRETMAKFPMPGYIRNHESQVEIERLSNRKDLIDAYERFIEDQFGVRSISYDFSADYAFEKHENSNTHYALIQKDKFTQIKRKNAFTVVLSDDTEILNTLITHGDCFDFVLGNSNIDDYNQDVEDSLVLSVIQSSSKSAKPIQAKKRKWSNDEVIDISLRLGLEESIQSRIRVFEFDISSASGNITLIFRRKLIMRLSDGYYSWFADGLTHLRSIKFSYKGISSLAYDFNVQHFFSSQSSVFQHDEDACECSIDYDNWIVRGQGAILVWRQSQS